MRRLFTGPSRILGAAPSLALIALVPWLGAACAGPGSSAGGSLTPEAELPPSYRETWRAFLEDREDWPQLREAVPADPGLAAFLVDNLVRVMVQSYDRGDLAQASDLPGLFERSRRELVRLAPYSAPVCIELMGVGDDVVAFLAGEVIAHIDDPAWTLPVAEKLTDPEPRARQRAAELLGELPYAREEEPRVLDLLEEVVLRDPEWFVRAQAATAIGRRAQLAPSVGRPREILCRALRDEDEAVRRFSALALVEVGDPEAIPALIDLLERVQRTSTNVGMLRTVQACLLELSGERTPLDVAAWREWYRENRR